MPNPKETKTRYTRNFLSVDIDVKEFLRELRKRNRGNWDYDEPIERLFIDSLLDDMWPSESEWCSTKAEAENKGNWFYEFHDYGKTVHLAGVAIEEFEVDDDEDFASGSSYHLDDKMIERDIIPTIKEWLMKKGYIDDPTEDDSLTN